MNLYDPNAQVSPRYTLANLSPTNQQLSEPNLPSESYMFDNLQTSAPILEYLDQQIGPFLLLSGFRTKELQNKLSSQGEPTSLGTSFHEVGRGFDISPTTMTPDEFFGKMLADPDIKSMFAEIAIKPSQHAIHFGTNIPGDTRETKVLGLNENDIYAKLSLDQLARYVEPILGSASAAMDYAEAELVTYNKTPLILAMVAALGGALYLALNKGPRLRKNPKFFKKIFTKKKCTCVIEKHSGLRWPMKNCPVHGKK